MCVTALGFVTNRIPTLDAMNLGGRLRYCGDAWQKVCSTGSWVYQVVITGYKKPLRSPPLQRVVRPNPPAKGPAHDVLVQEAIGLKAKGAVSSVSHESGEYIYLLFGTKAQEPGEVSSHPKS